MIPLYPYIKMTNTGCVPVGVMIWHVRDDIGLEAMGFMPVAGQILCKTKYNALYQIVGDANRPRQIMKRYPLLRKLLRLSLYEYDTELFNTKTHFRLPECKPKYRNPGHEVQHQTKARAQF